MAIVHREYCPLTSDLLLTLSTGTVVRVSDRAIAANSVTAAKCAEYLDALVREQVAKDLAAADPAGGDH